MSASTTHPTPERIMQFAWGYSVPLILEAAIQNRVFDVLDSGSKTVEEVSGETGASTRGLRAIMNALVSFDFLARDSQDRYSLTVESATFLVSTKPSFHGGLFRHISTQLLPKWLEISESVRTGKAVVTVNEVNQGSEFFEPFVEAIFPLSYPAALAVGDALKLSEQSSTVSVLDIAAGSGVWGIALAQKSAHVHVVAVDWPNVLEVTKRIAARFGLTDRFAFVAGDLDSADFGSGHHVATLGHILHSEGEVRSKQLLRKVFDSLAPGGTIVIAEMLPNDTRTGPPHALIFAVNMLIHTADGDTYPFTEISQWLSEAGFANARTLDAPGPSPLILATKPE